MKKLLILLLVPFIMGAAPTRVNNYTSGTTIRAAEVNEDFDNLYGYLQTGVDTLRTGAVDVITEIDSTIRSGSDQTVVTGTKGADGICAEWNADGDLVAAVSAAACGSGGAGSEVNNLETITTGIATTEIPIGTAGNTVVYSSLSGDITMDNGGVTTIGASKIDDGMLNTTDWINLPIQSAKISGSFITTPAGIDAGDPLWRGLFDDSATESMLWHFTAPTGCCASAVAKITYSMAGNNTTDDIDLEIEIMAVTDGEAMNSASFDAVNEVTGGTIVPDTADQRDTISLTLTNFDSGTAGESIIVRLNRDHDDGDDTAAGDVQLHEVNIQWTR